MTVDQPKRKLVASATASTSGSTTASRRFLKVYDRAGRRRAAPARLDAGWRSRCVFVASLALFPLLGLSFFPRTDAGQFVINLKAPTGTRIWRHRERSRQGGGPDPPGGARRKTWA